MRILSLNCQSWNTAKSSVNYVVDNNSIDLLCLSETFESIQEPLKFRCWSKISRARGDGYGGVAILYKDDEDGVYIQRRAELEDHEVEAICAEVSVKSKESFLLITAYIPPQKNDQMLGLIKIIKNCKSKFHHVLVTGDFNAKSLAWNNIKVNTCGTLLDGYLHESGLICMNDGQATRRASDSVIDLFLISPKLSQEVEFCQTLTHENVRSDHIGVLLELYKLPDRDPIYIERWATSNTDWDTWRSTTETGFKEWNSNTNLYETVDEMADSFMLVYMECLTKAVPMKLSRVQHRRKKPPWWTEETASSKHELNIAKKTYKRRRTPFNFNNLREKEDVFKKMSENSKEEWTQNLCKKISMAKSQKDMWDSFKNLTSYQDYNNGGVLPLLDDDHTPIFDNLEKCNILQNIFFGGRHLQDCEFDEGFKELVNTKMEELNQSESSTNTGETEEDLLNYDIDRGEVEAALQRLNKGKAPGPDKVYTDLLINAGNEMTEAIHKLFQKSWETGIIPAQWKEAEVKFLRKQGKKSYHDAGSYRPISLTSCLCKGMEKIITHRLYGYVEHRKLLDREQEGFRRFRGTSQALLRLTQDIFNGFNKKQHTVAIFIDLEKAYDSVWREGLMTKLYDMEIRGRIWKWICNFLSTRKASITIRGETGPKFDSLIGLPQGAVISSLLFNLYTSDIYTNVMSQKVKFADDGTIWKTGSNVEQLMESLEEDLKEVQKWSRKWRMKLNLTKTEFCVFSLDSNITEQWQTSHLSINNIPIGYNKNPKILGVTLDEKLRFEKHMETIRTRAHRSVELLRKVKESECIQPKCLIQLYKALILPQIEYAASVWQNGNCESLESVQRKGLAICLGLPGTSGIEAMEVEAGVIPLSLRREELSIREATRIMMKDNSNLIKSSWNNFMEQGQQERRLSPFGMINMQLADMTSNTGIQLHTLEKEMNYFETLQPSREQPEYWQSLGSSKNRTKLQEATARDIIGTMVEGCNTTTAIAFTDGSCMGNPGPCGSGSCIHIPNSEDPVCLKRAVSKCGSILLGELVAILLTIQYITDLINPQISKLHIFSDSQSVVGLLTLGWEATSHASTVRETKRAAEQLKTKGITLEISWTPGHSDISSNEIADQLAKQAAQEAANLEDSGITTVGDVKLAVKKSGLMKWQDRWDRSERGRHLFQYRPKVGVKIQHVYKSPLSECAISQLRTGYARLGEYQHKIGNKDSNLCQCGGVETVGHYLFQCPTYHMERERCWTKIQQTTGIIDRDANIILNVGSSGKDNHEESRDNLLEQLEDYILATCRFAKQ